MDLPCIAPVLAEEQRRPVDALDAAGALVAKADAARTDELAAVVQQNARPSAVLREIGRRAAAVIDGEGRTVSHRAS